MLYLNDKITLAYVTGVALGDGNLSNPNDRAVRLRITCDLKYPNLIKKIKSSIELIAPNNKVALVKTKGNCVNISCYSNDWEKVLGWKVGNKLTQEAGVPSWIFKNKKCKISCLRGLLQTDGCIYKDRGYTMVNFVNHNRRLAKDVLSMIKDLGFSPNFSSIIPTRSRRKYTIRIAKDVKKFIDYIDLVKK